MSPEYVPPSPSSSSLNYLYDDLLTHEGIEPDEDHYDDEDRLVREMNRVPVKKGNKRQVREYQIWGKPERNQRSRDPKADP